MKSDTKVMQRVVDGIEECFTRFPGMRDASPTIAFSGGKDSIALACALSEMGVSVTLRAIDMGYSSEWGGRIARMAHLLKLPLELVTVANLAGDASIDLAVREDLAVRRAFLDANAPSPSVTPCTNCYNCKILSLVHATGGETEAIYFAHHRQDALSSFLKSALMYLDRWEAGRVVFDKNAFRHLGQQVAESLRYGDPPILAKLARLIENKQAHTSEPPLEQRKLHGRPYRIMRPLFFVDEIATAALAAESGAMPEGSGCGHSAAAATRTPREIVHYELLPIISETAAGRHALRELGGLLADGLRTDGTATIDVRGARHVLLGRGYKGGPQDLADRL